MRRIVSQVLLLQSDLTQDECKSEIKQPPIPEQGLAHYAAPLSIFKLYLKIGVYIIDAMMDAIFLSPIRIGYTLYKLISRSKPIKMWYHTTEPLVDTVSTMQMQLDLIHSAMIWIMVYLFSIHQYFEFGFWYHIIRGQSQVKMYGIIQILDLLDRLACTQGDYIMKQLYWSRVNKTGSVFNRYLIYSFVYMFCHCCILGLQLTVYNVIFSSNINLLYLALFVLSLIKLKSSVFKKQDDKSCISMAINDGRELCQKVIYIILILLSVKYIPSDFFFKISFYFIIDLLVDSFKFISLFHLNSIPLSIIHTYSSEFSNFSFALTLQKKFVYHNMSLIDPKDLNSVLQTVPQAQLKTIGKLQFVVFPHAILVLRMLIYVYSKYSNIHDRHDYIISAIVILCLFCVAKLIVLQYQKQSTLFHTVQAMHVNKVI